MQSTSDWVSNFFISTESGVKASLTQFGSTQQHRLISERNRVSAIAELARRILLLWTNLQTTKGGLTSLTSGQPFQDSQ